MHNKWHFIISLNSWSPLTYIISCQFANDHTSPSNTANGKEVCMYGEGCNQNSVFNFHLQHYTNVIKLLLYLTSQRFLVIIRVNFKVYENNYMLWCIANTPSSQLPLFFISHFLSPLLGPSFSIFATFGIPSVLLLVISDYLFNTYLWEREHHICFAFVICILFNVDVHHTGNTIYIPCLLIQKIILNK